MERKREKMNCAKSSAKKNGRIIVILW